MEDIWGLFSDENFPSTGKSKKEKKEKSATKTNTKAAESYGLPLEVICDGRSHSLTVEETGKTEVTVTDIQEAVTKLWPWYPADISSIELIDNVAYVCYRNQGTQKGMITMKEMDSFRVMGSEMDLSNYVDTESETVEVSVIQDIIKKEYPGNYPEKSPLWKQISVLRSAKAGMLIALMPPDPVLAIPVTDDIKVVAPDGVYIEIGKERMLAELNNGDEKEPELIISKLEKILKEEGITLQNQLQVSKTRTDHLYHLYPITSVRKSTPTGKQELYPTQDTTLSVYYAKYILTPMDFNGQEKVDKNAILAFLVEKGHKEYSFCDVRINYSEKGKMILVSAVGSSKGAAAALPLEKFPKAWLVRHARQDCVEHSVYDCFIEDGKDRYHLFDTPMFTAVLPVPSDEHRSSYLDWKLPKIPGKLFAEGRYISLYTYRKSGCEVCMDLYFEPDSQTYIWNIPNQSVGIGAARTVTDPFLETTEMSGLIKVGQAHSHGCFHAFFSDMDNMDENIPGIYGVWGLLQCDKPEFKIRLLACFRQFLSISADMVFGRETEILSMEDRQRLEYKVNQHVVGQPVLFEPEYGLVELEGRKLLLLSIVDAEIFRLCKGIYVYDIYGQDTEYSISAVPKEHAVMCLLSPEPLESFYLETPDFMEKLIMTKKKMSVLECIG